MREIKKQQTTPPKKFPRAGEEEKKQSDGWFVTFKTISRARNSCVTESFVNKILMKQTKARATANHGMAWFDFFQPSLITFISVRSSAKLHVNLFFLTHYDNSCDSQDRMINRFYSLTRTFECELYISLPRQPKTDTETKREKNTRQRNPTRLSVLWLTPTVSQKAKSNKRFYLF